MNALPESLRRILAAQQGKKPVAARTDEIVRDCTVIWKDGEVLRVDGEGRVRQLRPATALSVA